MRWWTLGLLALGGLARADVSAPAARATWIAPCERALRAAARDFDGDRAFNAPDWSWHADASSLHVRFDAVVDSPCGAYDDFDVRVEAASGRPSAWRARTVARVDQPDELERVWSRRGDGRRAIIRRVHDDGGDFGRFLSAFRRAADACLAQP